jgi:hypothetical protein
MRSLLLTCLIFLALLNVVVSGGDIGITWGERARKICLRLAKNRAQRSNCETYEEVVTDIISKKSNNKCRIGNAIEKNEKHDKSFDDGFRFVSLRYLQHHMPINSPVLVLVKVLLQNCGNEQKFIHGKRHW